MDADVLKLIAFATACLWNRQAVPILALHAYNILLVYFFIDSGAYYFLLVAMLYAIASASNIKFLSSIRWVLITIAVLNWLAAVDFLLFEEVTMFYQSFPYLVNGLDAVVLMLLWGQGGKSVVGKFLALGHSGTLPVVACSMRHRNTKEATK